jgi:hypothetical protein
MKPQLSKLSVEGVIEVNARRDDGVEDEVEYLMCVEAR